MICQHPRLVNKKVRVAFFLLSPFCILGPWLLVFGANVDNLLDGFAHGESGGKLVGPASSGRKQARHGGGIWGVDVVGGNYGMASHGVSLKDIVAAAGAESSSFSCNDRSSLTKSGSVTIRSRFRDTMQGFRKAVCSCWRSPFACSGRTRARAGRAASHQEDGRSKNPNRRDLSCRLETGGASV